MGFAAPLLPTLGVRTHYSWSVSLGLLVIAFCFMLAGVMEFRRNRTTVDPRDPNKTTVLVDSGVYAVSRNPMYVGFALVLMAWVVFLRSPVLSIGVILFVVYMNRFQIAPEERALKELFGDDFDRYVSRVRRWI